MACEIPIVSNRGPHVEWLLNDRNSFLCDLTVESISETLSFAIDNPDESRERVERAKREISKLTWEGEAQKAIKFLELAD
jgi:glycosyltransferase involved in cell wall biosynthesis